MNIQTKIKDNADRAKSCRHRISLISGSLNRRMTGLHVRKERNPMISDLLNKRKKTLSFEVFPPKKEDEFEAAFTIMDKLNALQPDFISVTYGAGGSRSMKTIEIADYIQNTLHTDALAHMTCVGATKASIDNVLQEMKHRGLSNVLALRGDRPQYMTDEQFNSREFEHASDLAHYLHTVHADAELTIAGACYAEKHYEAVDMATDIGYMKLKQEQGVSFFISQLFFDNEFFYRFSELARNSGITVPILPGIMPLTSANQINTSVTLSGSSIPKKLADLIANYGENPDDMRKAGIDYAIGQIRALKEHDADGIHIYTMNRPKMTSEIVSNI